MCFCVYGIDFKEREKGFGFSCACLLSSRCLSECFCKGFSNGLDCSFELQMNACLLKDIVLCVCVCTIIVVCVCEVFLFRIVIDSLSSSSPLCVCFLYCVCLWSGQPWVYAV